MVFPYADHDLCGLLMNKDFKMSHSVAKLLFKQILEGLSYMHSNSIVHRDLKTANILVTKTGGVMIADFGLARTMGVLPMPKHSPHEYTNMVVTRWYRAPELLLGTQQYSTAIDLWSMGCIFGEMYLREPIFAGTTDRDQLVKIFSRVGAPNEKSWPGWERLPGFPDAKGHPWDKTHPETTLLQLARKWQMDRAGADLMSELLRLDPSSRPTADKALDHAWFWTDPLPASLGSMPKVESSHEMTTREREPSHHQQQVYGGGGGGAHGHGHGHGQQAQQAYGRPPPNQPPAWSNRGAGPGGPARPPYGGGGGGPVNGRPPHMQQGGFPGQHQQQHGGPRAPFNQSGYQRGPPPTVMGPQGGYAAPTSMGRPGAPPPFRLAGAGGPGCGPGGGPGGGGPPGGRGGPAPFKLAGGGRASGPSFGGGQGPPGMGGPPGMMGGGGMGMGGGPPGMMGGGGGPPMKRGPPGGGPGGDDWRADKRPRRDGERRDAPLPYD